MKQERIAELQGNGVRHSTCLRLNFLALIASEEAKAQKCH